MIGQIALQRIGPVGVNQSAAFANPERQNADALGHQFLVQPAQVSRQILPAGAGAGKEVSRLDPGQGGRTDIGVSLTKSCPCEDCTAK